MVDAGLVCYKIAALRDTIKGILSIWQPLMAARQLEGSERSWRNSTYYPDLCMEDLRKWKKLDLQILRTAKKYNWPVDCFTCRPFRVWFVQRHEADDASGVRLVTCRQDAVWSERCLWNVMQKWFGWCLLANVTCLIGHWAKLVQKVLFTCIVPPTWGRRWRSWLRYCAVAGPIPNDNTSWGWLSL